MVFFKYYNTSILICLHMIHRATIIQKLLCFFSSWNISSKWTRWISACILDKLKIENSEKKNQLQNYSTFTSKLICSGTLQRIYNSHVYVLLIHCVMLCVKIHVILFCFLVCIYVYSVGGMPYFVNVSFTWLRTKRK